MLKNQKVTRQNILNVSFDILKKEGFEHFTARRIAKKLHSSTQPLYKEFDNMDHLKNSLVVYIQHFLEKEVFCLSQSTHHMIDVCSNYIQFAKDEAILFSAIFMDRELETDQFYDYSYNALEEAMQKDEDFSDLSNKEREKVLHVIWSSIHGLAVLMVQGKIEYEENEWNEFIRHTLNSSLNIVST